LLHDFWSVNIYQAVKNKKQAIITTAIETRLWCEAICEAVSFRNPWGQ